jgi:hypothetical protein
MVPSKADATIAGASAIAKYPTSNLFPCDHFLWALGPMRRKNKLNMRIKFQPCEAIEVILSTQAKIWHPVPTLNSGVLNGMRDTSVLTEYKRSNNVKIATSFMLKRLRRSLRASFTSMKLVAKIENGVVIH